MYTKLNWPYYILNYQLGYLINYWYNQRSEVSICALGKFAEIHIKFLTGKLALILVIAANFDAQWSRGGYNHFPLLAVMESMFYNPDSTGESPDHLQVGRGVRNGTLGDMFLMLSEFFSWQKVTHTQK